MGWLIAAGILIGLAMLPIGVRLRYDSGGVMVKLLCGPIRMTLYPRPNRPKKEKQKKENLQDASKPSEETPAAPKPPEPPKKTGETKQKNGSVTDFLPLVQVALELLGSFRRKLRVDWLMLHLTLAGGDSCDLAVNYGRTWAAVGNLLPNLERIFVIKKRDIQVGCDFAGDKTRIDARLDLTITVGRLLALAVVYGLRALKEFLSIQKKRKGGAVT